MSDEKYVPTVDFLRAVYEKMNSEFFNDALPQNLKFTVKSAPSGGWLGQASYLFNRLTKTVRASEIELNSSRILSLHEWMETILHEMIHVYDYTYNPEHFLGRGRYDAHGAWFLTFGRKFLSDGYHVERFCKADIGVNTDDEKLKKKLSNIVLIEFDPGSVIVVSKTNLKKVGLVLAYKRFLHLKYYTTENPNVVRLSQYRPRDVHSGLRCYDMNEISKKYGPLKEIKMNQINEDKDETEFDDMNRIDDNYAKTIWDKVKGVVDVKEVGKDKVVVSIA